MEQRDRTVRTRVPTPDGKFVFGSACLVAPQRILTARHVLTTADGQASLGQPCEVRLYPCGPADDWVPARVKWLHPERDVAVITADGIGLNFPPVGWGEVLGDEPIRWTATGYPVAARDEDDRVEEGAFGRLAPVSAASKYGLELTVESRQPAPGVGVRSGWEGLSGAAVFSGKNLIGIVTADPTGHWTESLVGIRATGVIDQPKLAEHLGTAPELVPVTGVAGAQGFEPPEYLLRVKGARVSTAVDVWCDRDDMCAKLREALFQPAARILNVTGRRGIGKSAIVAKVAAEFEQPHPTRSEDFDALVYAAKLPGVDLTVARLFDNLVSLLDARTADGLRKDWDKSGESALPEVWESLRRRGTLVVLDNLDELQDPDSGALRDEGLVAFLRSAAETPYPPRVITTSQLPLLGLPADLQVQIRKFPVEDGLDAVDAIALLRSQDRTHGFAQFSDEELGLATSRVYGVPFGITKVGELLLQDDRWYLDELLETPEPAEERIQELVARVFEKLDEPGRQVVQLLALAGLPLKTGDVPRILDGVADSTVVRRAIRALTRAGGVRYRPEDVSVDLHPVEVDWVTHHLLEHDPSVQVTIDLRLADWYRGLRKPEAQRRLLEDVDPQLREFRHRWRAGDHDEALVALADAADFLSRHRETAAVRAAVKAAEAVELGPRGLVARESCRFEYEFFVGSTAAAEAAGRSALKAAEAAGMSDLVAELQSWIAVVLRYRGDNEAAIEMLLAVISADPEVERQVKLGALLELGIAYCYARRWDEALHVADELEAMLIPDDRRKVHAGPADIRSLARMGAGDYDGALSAASEAVEIYLDSPNQDTAGYAYNVAGLVWLLRDDLERATEQFDKGDQLAKDHNVDRLGGICSTNQAWTQLRAGNLQASLEWARRGSELLRQAQAGFAEAPRILHELVSQGTSADPLHALLQAAASARDNPDLYSPSDEMCRVIAATLAASRGA